MKKNAYLVVTDLHIDFQKNNRLDYFGEVLGAMQDILQINAKYLNRGYSVSLILLGDVCDRTVSKPSDAMQAVELLRYFCTRFSTVWSVVGNHEISYARDNPFWFLVSDLNDRSLSFIKRFIQPRGMNNTIIVPDCVDDGEVHIYFNHYGIDAKVPNTAGVNIGVFHQNVGSNDICKMWGTFDDVEGAAYIQAYNYCFFGHMHLAKGKYFLNEQHTCQGEWLGTIGRTKITEISNSDLEVNVPAILVEDGVFSGIEDNVIRLRSEEECIDYAKLQAITESKQVVEEQKKIAVNSYKGDTLYQSLQGVFAGTPFEFLLTFLDHDYNQVYYSYSQTLNNVTNLDREGDTGE